MTSSLLNYEKKNIMQTMHMYMYINFYILKVAGIFTSTTLRCLNVRFLDFLFFVEIKLFLSYLTDRLIHRLIQVAVWVVVLRSNCLLW